MFYNLTFTYIVKFGAVLYKNSELHVSVVTAQNFDKGGKHKTPISGLKRLTSILFVRRRVIVQHFGKGHKL
jgi:hypothetical protein